MQRSCWPLTWLLVKDWTYLVIESSRPKTKNCGGCECFNGNIDLHTSGSQDQCAHGYFRHNSSFLNVCEFSEMTNISH